MISYRNSLTQKCFHFIFFFFLEMLSFYNLHLSCGNVSLFLPPIFTEDGEQFITLFSGIADAMLEENYDLVFLFLSHSPRPHPKHTAILHHHFHFSERK